MPRSFFSADHHDNTRSGKAKGMKLTNIWDLDKVHPMFRVPSCVLFAQKAKIQKALPKDGLQGKNISGSVPSHNCNWKEAENKLTEEDVIWFYSKQGKSTAFSLKKGKSSNKINSYKSLFKNGATLYPRAFMFVELTQETPPDFVDRIINCKTSGAIQPDAKTPWKGLDFSGRIESIFFFRTALAKNVLPFMLFNPELIILPLLITKNKHLKKEIRLYNAKELIKEGFLQSSKWFQNAENIWDINKTEKNSKVSLLDCINWQGKLANQHINTRYLVLYNSSAKDANAVVVDRNEQDLEFIVENTTYVCYTDDDNEAYYLTSILNSAAPNEMMKDFQAKGLFGARHVHKKILDVYFPKYDEANKTHQQLAALSKACHAKAAQYIKDNPPQQELSAIHLGRIRVAIKKYLVNEMKEIDGLVKKIIG